jgi:hypothetical protein
MMIFSAPNASQRSSSSNKMAAYFSGVVSIILDYCFEAKREFNVIETLTTTQATAANELVPNFERTFLSKVA